MMPDKFEVSMDRLFEDAIKRVHALMLPSNREQWDKPAPEIPVMPETNAQGDGE
jgi:hypothetical protein